MCISLFFLTDIFEIFITQWTQFLIFFFLTWKSAVFFFPKSRPWYSMYYTCIYMNLCCLVYLLYSFGHQSNVCACCPHLLHGFKFLEGGAMYMFKRRFWNPNHINIFSGQWSMGHCFYLFRFGGTDLFQCINYHWYHNTYLLCIY